MIRSRPFGLGVVLAIAVVTLQALLVPLFAGPAAHLEPRDLPIALAGPPSATAAWKAKLVAAHPGAFDIRTVPDAASADEGIRDRSVYGAIVLTPNDVVMHVTSAGSPAVAALLTQTAAALGPGQVLDVVPTDPHDPRGAGLGAAFLPLAMTSLLGGALIFMLVAKRAARIAGLLTFGLLAGLAGAAVQQYWLRVLPGDYGSNAAAIGLIALAIAATVTGCGALLGRAGVAIAVAVVFLVGNALSAVAAAPELLPQPWGIIGHYLPIGAGATLLRSAVYFGGSGATAEAASLIAYVIGGLGLVLAGRRGLGPRAGSEQNQTARGKERVRAGVNA